MPRTTPTERPRRSSTCPRCGPWAPSAPTGCTQGQLPGEFLLYRDGSVGRCPCPEHGKKTTPALTDWARWHCALTVLGVRPPWTTQEFEDFDEWLSVLIEETELGCADDAT